MRGSPVVRIAVLVAVLASFAVVARAQVTAPTAEDLVSLNASLRPGTPVHVLGTLRPFSCYGVSLAGDGVHFREAFRFGATAASLPRSPVAWADVQRIEVGHTSIARGAIVGMVFGAVAGGIWNRMDSSNENRSGFVTWVDTRGTADGPIHLALGTVGGAAMGAAIGAAAKHWEVIWPRR